MPVTITDAHIRATVEGLTAEAESVVRTVEAAKNADKELLALNRAVSNTLGALRDQASKLTARTVDAAITALDKVHAEAERKTQASPPSFDKGDELARAAGAYASLAALGELNGWTVEDFQPALDAWNAIPRRAHARGSENPSLPFAVVLERNGEVIDRAGERSGRVFVQNLKGKIEKAALMKLTRDNPQWKGLKASLERDGVAIIGNVTVRRVGQSAAAA